MKRRAPNHGRRAIVLMLAGALLPAAFCQAAEPITSTASATEAAKHLMKVRCAGETACKYKAEREGKQWRVWVHFSKRADRAGARPVADGYVVLYFDGQGTLIRRVEGE